MTAVLLNIRTMCSPVLVILTVEIILADLEKLYIYRKAVISEWPRAESASH